MFKWSKIDSVDELLEKLGNIKAIAFKNLQNDDSEKKDEGILSR